MGATTGHCFEIVIFDCKKLQVCIKLSSITISIFACTWNVNARSSVPLSGLLQPSPPLGASSPRPDVYVIGFQEIDMSADALLRNESTKGNVWQQAIEDGIGNEYKLVWWW